MTIDPAGIRHFMCTMLRAIHEQRLMLTSRVTGYSYNALGQKIQTRVYAQSDESGSVNTPADYYDHRAAAGNELPGLNLLPSKAHKTMLRTRSMMMRAFVLQFCSVQSIESIWCDGISLR